ALTVKYDDNLSAGRVQTPTLAFVRQAEKKIEKFRPHTYYVIELQAKGQKARAAQQFDQETAALAFMEKLQKQQGTVTAVTDKVKTEAAPLPYDLTEIQREANQRYGFSAKKTLSLVQSLYETHKVVTYPRTDSKYLTTDMKQTMKERLSAVANFAPEVKTYLKNGSQVVQKTVFNDSKVGDHHALIPTEQRANAAKFSNDEQKIYNMIVSRFLSLFALPHRRLQQKVTVEFGKESFTFTQNKVLEAGWKIETDERFENVQWQKGQQVSADFQLKKELTKPPKPLNEGSLLLKMEKFGLGTPATRAEIIEKLVRSELMERTPSDLQVSPKGKQLLELVNHSLVSP